MQSEGKINLRAWQNVVASTASYLIPTALFLLTTPFVLSRMGAELYGTWQTLQTIESVLAILDLGISPTLIKYLAESYSRGHRDEVCTLIRVAIMAYTILGGLGAAGLLICAPLLTRAFHLSALTFASMQLLFLLLSADLAVRMLSAAPRAVPAALHRFDLLSTIELLARSLGTLLVLILLAAGGTLESLLWGALGISSLRALSLVWLSGRLVPGLNWTPSFHRATVQRTIHFNFYNAIQALAGQVFTFLDRLMIGLFLGPNAVSYYSIADRLAIQINSILAEATRFLFPLSSSLTALDRGAELGNILQRAAKLLFLASCALALPLVVAGPKLVYFWLGPSFAASSGPVLQLLAIGYGLSVLFVPYHYFLNGSGQARLLGLWLLAAVGLQALLYAVLIPLWGLIGASAAWIFYVLLNILFLAVFILPRTLHRPMTDVLRFSIPSLLALIPALGLELVTHLSDNATSLLATVIILMGYFVLVLGSGIVIDRWMNPADSILRWAGHSLHVCL